MTDEATVRAGIYTRISLAVLNDTTKTDDQERQCRELCGRRRWEVAEVFTDLSRSAWQRNRKRDGWDSLLAAVGDGRINAIVTYWGDRLVRQPRDLEDLLDLRENRQITLASIAGQYDFDNPDHRMMMRWEVARACNESDNLSRRKRNQYARMRAQGLTRPGGAGGRCFGFETDGVTHRPDEAEAIRQVAAAVLSGRSLGSAIRDLRDAGFRTTAGNELRQASFRRTLLSPRMAGLMPDAASKAAWEPVIERASWEAFRVALDMNEANPRAGRGALHLLSGIARCGVCTHAMWIALKGGKSYRCPDCSKVSRNRILLDAYVTRRTVNRLNHPATPTGKIPEAPGLAAEFAALAGARAEIEAAMADHTRGRLPLLLARLDSLDSRLAELREVAAGDAAARLRGTHAGITEKEFGALPLQVRRSLVAACFTVRVLPASKRGPGFRTEDVEMTPL